MPAFNSSTELSTRAQGFQRWCKAINASTRLLIYLFYGIFVAKYCNYGILLPKITNSVFLRLPLTRQDRLHWWQEKHLLPTYWLIKYDLLLYCLHLVVIGQVEMIDFIGAVLVEVVSFTASNVCPDDFHVVISVRSTLGAEYFKM